jgi:hypothetical protein
MSQRSQGRVCVTNALSTTTTRRENNMRIVYRDGEWVVLAVWYGQERAVFRNASVFECCDYVAMMERGSNVSAR